MSHPAAGASGKWNGTPWIGYNILQVCGSFVSCKKKRGRDYERTGKKDRGLS